MSHTSKVKPPRANVSFATPTVGVTSCTDARAGFSKVAAKVPNNVVVQFNLGVIAEKQGKLSEAAGFYETANKLDPKHKATLLNLGRVYRLQDKFDNAISLYENALKDPANEYDVELNNNLTVAYRLAKKYAQAEATARKVLARTRDNRSDARHADASSLARHLAASGEGEFVVLAMTDRLARRDARGARNARELELHRHLRLRRDVAEIAAEAVADIDHGAETVAKRRSERVRSRDARREVKVAAEARRRVPRPADRARDIDAVAHARVGARRDARRRRERNGENRDACDDRRVLDGGRHRGDVAPDERRRPSGRRLAQALGEAPRARLVDSARKHRARDGRDRARGAHRGDIAQIPQHRLASDEIRVAPERRVTAFDGAVGRDEHAIAAGKREERHVVARRNQHRRWQLRVEREDPVEEGKLAHRVTRGCARSAAWR
jgi:tetratricopeptide (TPR) repeat protein